MTKIPKFYIEGALYYITSRGDNNGRIFQDAKDYQTYMDLLKKYKENYGFKLFAFCLLPNHLHLLIELKEGVTISQIMHGLNSNYTKYFNARYGLKGHLLQERNKVVVAQKITHLLPLVSYIHLNPKVSGLAPDLEEYVYSSYPAYSGCGALKAGPDLKEEIGEVCRSAGLPAGRSGGYKDFIKNISREEMNNYGKELGKKVIFGQEEFVEKVKAEISHYEAQMNEPRVSKIVSRRFILAGSIVVVILGLFMAHVYVKNLGLKNKLNTVVAQKNQEFVHKLDQEKEFIKKDLQEKYNADKVSYEVMAKRLEIEKRKVKELEQKR